MHAWKSCIGSLLGLAVLAPGAAAQDLSSPKWTPWLELGGFYGSKDTSRGEAVLWVPLAQSQTSVLFGEARGKLFEDDMREGNFALGYRQMQASGWNLGVWGGYDIRESRFGNSFHQLAGGIEALSDRWDFRANTYLPLNDSENLFRGSFTNMDSTVGFTGSTIGLVTTTTTTTVSQDELALWGFDAEIGAKVFSTPLDLTGPRHELRLYAGAYHFDHSDLPSSVSGPRVRAEWRMDDVIDQWAGSRLTFEAEYSHDQLRDGRVEVGARLRLPFGDSGSRVASRTLTAQERRMSEGLERDTDIVTDTKATSSTTASTATEAVEDAETGVRFDRVAAVDGTGSLTATSTAAGANSLIIADGGAGDITGAQVLSGDQTLQGGGSTIQVRGVTSGIVVDFTAPGTRPTFLNTANSAILSIGASNTHISGVNVEGALGVGLSNRGINGGSGKSNIRISNVDIAHTDGTGIYFFSNNTVAISGVTLSDIRGHGMFFFSGNTVDIVDTTIERGGGSGVVLDTLNRLFMADTSLIDLLDNGLSLYDDNAVTATRVTFKNIGGNGLAIGSGSDVTLQDSTMTGTVLRGVRLSFAGQTLSGTGNSAAGATFTDTMCWDLAAPGTHTGQIVFDIGTCP